MLEHSVALAQSALTLPDGKHRFTVRDIIAVKNCCRSRVVTCIKTDKHQSRLLTREPRIPLINAASSVPEYFLASSTASLTATDAGTPSTSRIS